VRQQLNLVNPALLPPKPFFQFRSMALALAVLVCVLAAFSALIFSRVSMYEQSAALSEQRATVEKAQVAALEEKSGKRQISAQVADEQLAVEAEKQRLEVLAGQIAQLGGQLGGQPGGQQIARSRADVLYALARRPAEGLWLTGVEVQGERIALDGMALNASAIPVWLAQLQESPVFAGQRFGGIEIVPGAAASASAPVTQTALTFHLTAMPAAKRSP
jgi:Tfp pilus assembly protein PilN